MHQVGVVCCYCPRPSICSSIGNYFNHCFTWGIPTIDPRVVSVLSLFNITAAMGDSNSVAATIEVLTLNYSSRYIMHFQQLSFKPYAIYIRTLLQTVTRLRRGDSNLIFDTILTIIIYYLLSKLQLRIAHGSLDIDFKTYCHGSRRCH